LYLWAWRSAEHESCCRRQAMLVSDRCDAFRFVLVA
jgi:hypothetical protein